jgi:GTP-binding protein
VGKFTLLSRVSAAKPKIADYPFTTLVPNLGVVGVDRTRAPLRDGRYPRLIENAHQGAGLGIQFLKHLERTRLLLHLLDVSGLSGREDSIEDYFKINAELEAFSEELSKLPQIVVLARVDLVNDRETLRPIIAFFESQEIAVFPVSGVTGEGIEPLLYHIWGRLKELPKPDTSPDDTGVVVIRAGAAGATAARPRTTRAASRWPARTMGRWWSPARAWSA